jgi:hypothetical protein
MLLKMLNGMPGFRPATDGGPKRQRHRAEYDRLVALVFPWLAPQIPSTQNYAEGL